jgi:hypothetical protein
VVGVLVSVVLALSVGLFLLASCRRWGAISASVLAFARIVFLEPDLQYALDIRDATAYSSIEPFLPWKLRLTAVGRLIRLHDLTHKDV